MAERTGTKPMVIVGGGKAGGTAAATLREDGFGGPVVIISAEPGIPFGRPPLSKTYLRSAEDLEGWYIKPASWYEEHDVELLAESTVTAIDATAHSLALASGRELEYQKLCCGQAWLSARARSSPSPQMRRRLSPISQTPRRVAAAAVLSFALSGAAAVRAHRHWPQRWLSPQ